MRIGIVTFWQSQDNYGQLLQCWALQQFLKQLGHEPFLIRYSLYGRFSLLRWIRKLLKLVLTSLRIKSIAAYDRKSEIRHFDEFRNKYLEQTKSIYSTLEALQKNPPVADAYIVGSDQVWNPILLEHERYRAFWLDFGNDKVKRIAYAASFGTGMFPQNLQGELSRQLSRFDALSVREESGVTICTNVGCQATHVLDPTLLLPMTDYTALSFNVPVKKTSYIYIYSINIADKEDIQWSELCSFASEEHLSPIVTPASGYLPGRELFDEVEYCYATIPQWISLIQHSNLVVTTSFHGVVFCILLHKHFVYFPLSGINSKGNERVLNLLSRLRLSESVWKELGDYQRIFNHHIDWIEVEELLSDLREESFAFLRQALS